LDTLSTQSFGTGVNRSQTVVGYTDTASHTFVGFRWTKNSGMRPISGRRVALVNVANAINDAGQVVGCNGSFPYRLTGALLEGLGTFAGSFGCANGINSQGQVAGYSYTSGDQGFHAFSGGKDRECWTSGYQQGL